MSLILKTRQRNNNSPQTLQLKYQDIRALKIVHFINSNGTFFNTSALGDILQLLLILPEQCASWTIRAEKHSEWP